MKKIILLILLCTILLIGCVSTQEEVPKFDLISVGTGSNQPFNINAFTFSALYIEDIIFRFSLHKDLSKNEIIEISSKIYENMKHFKRTEITIKDYRDNKDLFIIINPVENVEQKRLDFVLVANINPKTNEIYDTKEVNGNFWGMFYTLHQGYLVNTSTFAHF